MSAESDQLDVDVRGNFPKGEKRMDLAARLGPGQQHQQGNRQGDGAAVGRRRDRLPDRARRTYGTAACREPEGERHAAKRVAAAT